MFQELWRLPHIFETLGSGSSKSLPTQNRPQLLIVVVADKHDTLAVAEMLGHDWRVCANMTTI